MKNALVLLLASVACCLAANIPIPTSDAATVGGRIAGGHMAVQNQFTYMASVRSLLRGETKLCGATIISNYWVLTAAHCTIGRQQYTLRFGSLFTESAGQVQTSFHAVNHPAYDPITMNNDISLVQVPRLLWFSMSIGSIRLPARSQAAASFAGLRTTTMGWGATGHGLPNQIRLRYVDMRTIPNAECARFYDGQVSGNTICALGYTNPSQQGVCGVDAGGPLVRIEDGVPTLIGVVSFHAERPVGCDGGHPSGFTRTASYLPWIHRYTAIELRD